MKPPHPFTVHSSLFTQLHLKGIHSLNYPKALAYIKQTTRTTNNDLALALDTSAAHVTGLSDALVRSGLITQEYRVEGEDRRKVFYTLTDKGVTLSQHITLLPKDAPTT